MSGVGAGRAAQGSGATTGTERLRETVLPTYARADVTIVRGEGCRVWDDGGRPYLDFVAGIAVIGLGHGAPGPLAAAHAQLDRLWHASNLYWTEPMLHLAALLGDRLPHEAQAFFCNSGAEANEAALKLARRVTGRRRVVALAGGFHGRTLGALSATGQPDKWEGFGPLVPGMAFARPNEIESLEAAVGAGGDVALVLLEPVLGEGGVVPLEPRFAAAAAEIAAEVGALLCLDEVQAGMGRTGTFFAHEQLGIEPDVVTLAKGLGNGLPIGALLASRRAYGGLQPGQHGSTFGGNPVAAAAACAVVEAIDEDLLAAVRARGEQLAAGLRALPGVVEVRGSGLLVGAELEIDGAALVAACRERGLLVLTAGQRVLRLTPPLVVSESEVDEALEVLAAALRAAS